VADNDFHVVSVRSLCICVTASTEVIQVTVYRCMAALLVVSYS